MKKAIALMLSVLFVLGLASFAAAEITVKGDARARGIWKNNFDMDKDVPDHIRYYDQRIRFDIKAENEDKAGVGVRITAGDNAIWGNGGASSSTADEYNVDFREDDYAYIYAPVGPVNLTIGLQPADWGNKFWAWGVSRERIKAMYKMDDITVGVFTQKSVEKAGAAGATTGLKDTNAHAALAIGTFGDFKVGGIVVYAKNDNLSKDNTGTSIDVFVNGKTGGASIAGELAYLTGELNKTDKNADGKKDSSPMGFFVSGGMNMDAFAVSGAFAYTKNGYVANKYFTPTVLFGKSQPTALDNLGEVTGAKADTMAIVLGASTKVSDDMTVGAKFAYADMKEYGVAANHGKAKINEFDATFDYKIGAKTNYNVSFGYAKAKGSAGWAGDAENLWALAHSINLTFE